MVETARRSGVPLIGHAPVNLGIDEMLQMRQSVGHLGVLDNIYFLPFSSHPTILIVTAVAILIVICLALTSFVSPVLRRGSKRMDGNESAGWTISKLTGVIALATVLAFICVFAYLPGGPLFDSTLLRVAFTALAGIVTAARS